MTSTYRNQSDGIAAINKAPGATLDYTWDWTNWLATGETITAHTLTLDPAITKTAETASTTSVTAWVSGGVAGNGYLVKCSITTSAGRIDERTIRLYVVAR